MDRMKRKREHEERRELDAALQDFEKDFGGGPRTETKAFIRADVVNANKSLGGERELYKPSSTVLQNLAAATAKKPNSFEEAKRLAAERAQKMLADAARSSGMATAPVVIPSSNRLRPPRPGQNKEVQKSKTSNLEAFKEELRMMQEEREKRRGLRDHLVKNTGLDVTAVDRIAPSLDNPYLRPGGEYDHDPDTTNLYVCNLPLDIKMEELLETFGSYGPLASARILYPRSELERTRDHLCGFLGFMCRVDVERAMASLTGLTLRGEPIKYSLAKPVAIPPQPFYVPPALQQYAFPDPPTGLPFNAKPLATDLKDYLSKHKKLPNVGTLPEDESAREQFKKMLKNAVVRVVIPTDSSLLAVIHRTIEFVVREGPEFEDLLLEEQAHNEIYQFLYNYHHPAHIYYRWKLYSILQGDTPYQWRTERFRMNEEGSWWEPPLPPHQLYSAMPRSLYHTSFMVPRPENEQVLGHQKSRKRVRTPSPAAREKEKRRKTRLRTRDRDRLEDLLRDLTPEKQNIGKAMLWCVEHAMAAKEIVECIVESLCLDETPLHKKIARLYLVSDILANCAIRGLRDVSYFRQYFGEVLIKIFAGMGRVLQKISARLKAEQFKQRVMACFQAWETTSVYSTEVLVHSQNVFLGLVECKEESSSSSSDSESDGGKGDDIDGVPLEQAKQMQAKNMSIFDDEGDDAESAPPAKKPAPSGSFKPVAWAEVDSSAPAVKSKWDEDEESAPAVSKWERPKWESVESARVEKMDTSPSRNRSSATKKSDPEARREDTEEGELPDDGSGRTSREEQNTGEKKKSDYEMTKERLYAELKAKVDALRRQLIEDQEYDIDPVVSKFEKEQAEKIEKQLQEMKKDKKKDKEKDKKKDEKKREKSREKERSSRRSRSRSPHSERRKDRDSDRRRESDRGDRRRSPDRRRSRSPERRRR